MIVYRLWNKANNKSFIGQTNNYKKTISRTVNKLRKAGYPNKKLQRDWWYGKEEDFVFEIIAINNTINSSWESAIKATRTYNSLAGYNKDFPKKLNIEVK